MSRSASESGSGAISATTCPAFTASPSRGRRAAAAGPGGATPAVHAGSRRLPRWHLRSRARRLDVLARARPGRGPTTARAVPRSPSETCRPHHSRARGRHVRPAAASDRPPGPRQDPTPPSSPRDWRP
jgi:hypothetical protein